MPTKTTKKQQQKVLSQAAQKRLELERQEAAKSKTEKLAESIQNRSTIAAKHDSVVKQVNTVKTRNTPTRKVKLNPIKKVKEAAPMKRGSDYENYLAKNEERNQRHHHLFKQAETLRNRLAKLTNRETVKLHEALRDCYGMYEAIENNPDADVFYNTIKAYYYATLEKIQSNTPNEGLLARFIFPRKSSDDKKTYTKRISEYATVLRYARQTNVAKKDFIKWYTDTTQTRILEKARKSSTADHKDRMMRARTVLLRYFDIREQWPLGFFDYPEYLAGKQVHLPNDLIFVICRGVRKFNRDIQFNSGGEVIGDYPVGSRVPLAEIRALHFIPTSIDMVNDMVNRLARDIAGNVGHYEEELNKKTEQVWADDMSNYLMERELGHAYKSADRWADRQQAALAEDQVEFENKRKKIQKLRNQARK